MDNHVFTIMIRPSVQFLFLHHKKKTNPKSRCQSHSDKLLIFRFYDNPVWNEG